MTDKAEYIGPLMIDLAGCEISAQEKDWLQHPAVGGVILFTRNFLNKTQLTDLVAQLRAIKSETAELRKEVSRFP